MKHVLQRGLPAVAILAAVLGPSPTPAAGNGELDPPEDDRFEKEVLSSKLHDPMELGVASDGRVFFIERYGNVKLYAPASKTTTLLHKIDVFHHNEDGLLGLALDPRFDKTHFIYLMYSDPKVAEQHVSRFTFGDDKLDPASEKVLLRVPIERNECCHSGGSLAFGPGDNLFISTGDNTDPFGSDGFSPSDERPGRRIWDAQRTSANSNDLRGKILRIHPEPDGTYTIPRGNLFPKSSKSRPEIYVMGCRNPFRISVDPKSGFLYWGEVGPDANTASAGRGPRGHDEINQARRAGFFGWPLFVGDNKPYARLDFETKHTGPFADAARPRNASPNNTGLDKLPPAQKALIYYPYARSDEFPAVGTGGRTAMAGPVYHFDPKLASEVKFPGWYDGALVIYEWMRDWIKIARLDKDGRLKSIEPFMERERFPKPMDMQFGPDGALYLIEFGTKWADNFDSRVVRLVYRRGNREPIVKVSAGDPTGKAPLAVKFSSAGTFDRDREDKLSYEWRFERPDRVDATDPNPSFVFKKPGTYKAELTVRDQGGKSGAASVEVVVGNSRPKVAVDVAGAGSFFDWDQALGYRVKVADAEDGTTDDGRIIPQRVLVNAIYRRGGAGDEDAQEQGLALMKRSTCFACHTLADKSQGPPYIEVARKYMNDTAARLVLANKIISGGTGVWGQAVMMPNPQHTLDETKQMVDWVLSLARDKSKDLVPGTAGKIKTIAQPRAGDDAGVYVLTATYTDNAAPPPSDDVMIRPLTGEAVRILRARKVEAERYDSAKGVQVSEASDEGDGEIVTAIDDGDFIAFKGIDLSGTGSLTLRVASKRGPKVEIRLDAPGGPRLVSVAIPDTSGGQKWENVTAPVRNPGGVHDLYFVFVKTGADSHSLMSLNWIRFDRPAR